MVQTVKIHLDSMIYQHSRISRKSLFIYRGKFHLSKTGSLSTAFLEKTARGK